MAPLVTAQDSALHPAQCADVQNAMLDLLFNAYSGSLLARLATWRIQLDGPALRRVDFALRENNFIFRDMPRTHRVLNEVYMVSQCNAQLNYYFARFKVPGPVGAHWKKNMLAIEGCLNRGHQPETRMSALADVCSAVLNKRLVLR